MQLLQFATSESKKMSQCVAESLGRLACMENAARVMYEVVHMPCRDARDVDPLAPRQRARSTNILSRNQTPSLSPSLSPAEIEKTPERPVTPDTPPRLRVNADASYNFTFDPDSGDNNDPELIYSRSREQPQIRDRGSARSVKG